MPIPAVAQIPDAVLSPFMVLPALKITPAPKKLTPLMTCAAMRAGSAVSTPLYKLPSALTRSEKPYFESIISRHAVQATIAWVRMPASLSLRVRSMPISIPHTPASTMRSPKMSSVVMGMFKLSVSIIRSNGVSYTIIYYKLLHFNNVKGTACAVPLLLLY